MHGFSKSSSGHSYECPGGVFNTLCIVLVTVWLFLRPYDVCVIEEVWLWPGLHVLKADVFTCALKIKPLYVYVTVVILVALTTGRKFFLPTLIKCALILRSPGAAAFSASFPDKCRLVWRISGARCLTTLFGRRPACADGLGCWVGFELWMSLSNYDYNYTVCVLSHKLPLFTGAI